MTEEQRQNRLKVINLLRDKSQWPKDFTWDFRRSDKNCGCAIPLAKRCLNISLFDPVVLGLSSNESMSIFCYPVELDFSKRKEEQPWNNWELYDAAWKNTTPEDVAKKLEATL